MIGSNHIIKNDSKYILDQIASGFYATRKRPNGRSIVWEVFHEVVKEDQTIYEGYAYCSLCHTLIRFFNDQTSNLNRHTCAREYKKSVEQKLKLANVSTYVENIPNNSNCQESTRTFEGHRQKIAISTKIQNPSSYSSSDEEFLKQEPESDLGEEFLTDDEAQSKNAAFIAEKIAKGSYTLSEKRKGRSDIWTIMAEILKEDNTIVEDFICCRVCKQILDSNTGRIRLYRHKCYVIHKWGDENDQDIDPDEAALLQEKITKGIYKISKRLKVTSNLWHIIYEIRHANNDSKVKGRVYCIRCRSILKLSTKYYTNLYRHKCYREYKRSLEGGGSHSPNLRREREEETVVDLSTSDEDNTMEKVKPSDDNRKEAFDLCTKWMTKEDCGPISSLNTKEFVKLMNFFLKMGSTNDQRSNLVSDPRTFLPKFENLAEDIKFELTQYIAERVKYQEMCATMDMWKETTINRTFFTINLHYQKNSKLCKLFLGIISFESQTFSREDLSEELLLIFNEFGIYDYDISAIKFVSSSEELSSLLSKTFKNAKQFRSNCHLLSDVLDKAFVDTKELDIIIQSCRNLKEFLNTLKLQEGLSITSIINQKSTPDWYSSYTMIKSLYNNWSFIEKIRESQREPQNVFNINTNLLKSFHKLMRNFDKIFKELQKSTTASICYVIPSIQKIKSLCSPKISDLQIIAKLKLNILRIIDVMWTSKLDIWHKTAFFLYPPAVGLQNQQDQEDIKKFCLKSMISLKSKETSDIETFSMLKSKYFSSDELIPNDSNPEQELQKYSQEVVEVSQPFDPIRWWTYKANIYPNLSKLALQILSIPASSKMPEEILAMRDNLVFEKLYNLPTETINNLLFLQSYNNTNKLN